MRERRYPIASVGGLHHVPPRRRTTAIDTLATIATAIPFAVLVAALIVAALS